MFVGRKYEIDIVGLGDSEILFAECKYINEKVGIDVYEKLLERSNLLPSEKSYYYIFSKNGFKNDLLELEKNLKDLNLITLDYLISKFK